MPTMTNAAERALEHFEGVWSQGDEWELDGAFDVASRQAQIALIADRRYERTLEIGCAAGRFTELLADLSDDVLGIDIAPSAIEAARARGVERPGVRLAASDVMEFDFRSASWDLITMSETISSVGALYTFFELGWMLREMAESQPSGGRLLMANTYGREKDYTLAPWIVNAYFDLVHRVGYDVEHREMFRGVKNDIEFEVVQTLFVRP